MPILISLTALLLPVALLQLSSGGVGPLDALLGFELNFTTAQIGALRSAHFVGFFYWLLVVSTAVGHGGQLARHRLTVTYANYQPNRLGADAGRNPTELCRILYRYRSLVVGQSDQSNPRPHHGGLSRCQHGGLVGTAINDKCPDTSQLCVV
jgi:hypothetical protein